MKYAFREKEVIIQRKEEAEKKLKATAKEQDDLLPKVKTLTSGVEQDSAASRF